MISDNLSTQEIRQGYTARDGVFRCTACGEQFETGEVYPSGGRFFEAPRAVELHMRTAHPDHLHGLIHNDTKYNTLTDHQKRLLERFASGASDKEIAGELGVSLSTVRHQKFTFREKAKQARLYLAVYESVFSGAGRGAAIVPIHDHARQVDERYVVTEEERAHILETSFISLEPLRLGQFSPREKKKVVVLAKICELFEPGHSYTEREVSDILRPVFDDFATLRRYLIEYGFMQRTRDGNQYRLT